MNALLLCHGALKEFSSFQLADKQVVQYRGNFGTNLSSGVAIALVHALLSDPLVTDAQIAKSVENYKAQDPLRGKGSFSPDINLGGDNNLVCFFMNMGTGRWLPLGSGWRSTLSQVCANLGAPLWLNLLCCTALDGPGIQKAGVKDDLMVKDWSQVLK